jgi:hypothetical protein
LDLHVAEVSANRFSAAGGVGVVLQFGWFYGPGATHSEEFLALARRRICAMMGPPTLSRLRLAKIRADDECC